MPDNTYPNMTRFMNSKSQKNGIPEKRRFPRSEVQIWVKERMDASTYYHLITQLSLNGFFIEKKLPFPLNAEVMIEMRLPHTRDTINLKGIVVNNYQEPDSSKKGMGIKISEIDQKSKNIIKDYLDSLADNS